MLLGVIILKNNHFQLPTAAKNTQHPTCWTEQCSERLHGPHVNYLRSASPFTCREEEEEDEEEDDGGEDPYEFSLSAVIDECARMASSDNQANQGASASGGTTSRKRKIVQSSYFSDEEDED